MRFPDDATLDNSASLLTQMIILLDNRDPECSNVNKVGSGEVVDEGRCPKTEEAIYPNNSSTFLTDTVLSMTVT